MKYIDGMGPCALTFFDGDHPPILLWTAPGGSYRFNAGIPQKETHSVLGTAPGSLPVKLTTRGYAGFPAAEDLTDRPRKDRCFLFNHHFHAFSLFSLYGGGMPAKTPIPQNGAFSFSRAIFRRCSGSRPPSPQRWRRNLQERDFLLPERREKRISGVKPPASPLASPEYRGEV